MAQYRDAFLQATAAQEGSNSLRDLVSKTSSDTFEHAKSIAPALQARHSAAIISSMSEDAFKEIKGEQFKVLGLKEASYTGRESAIEELSKKVGAETGGTIQETVEKIGKKATEAYEGFVQKAKESFEGLAKDNELYKLSKKSARSANRRIMMGNGVKIGIVVALLGSFVLGFISSRRAKKQAAAMEAAAQKQAPSALGEDKITPEQMQMMAQMMAQQQAASAQNPVQAQSAMSQIKPLQVQSAQPAPPPQPQIPPQTAHSVNEYFKTPMQSPLI